ncbi:MAG: hypothetical protein GY702_20510 [Desulfobulbaceae bacterium]|nr:hypothetical protein [Desulfobulbaceae bacterium]
MKKEYDLNLPAQGKKGALSPGALLSIETLLRLNPHWIVEDVSETGNHFSAALKDHESGKSFELNGSLSIPDPQALMISLEAGDYGQILIYPQGDDYWAEVEYNIEIGAEGEEEGPEEAVERLMVLWLRAIKEYLRMYLKNSINTVFFRYIMNKIILKMTPSQRKISLMLIRITVVEIIVILFIVIAYVIFVLRPLASP